MRGEDALLAIAAIAVLLLLVVAAFPGFIL